MKLAFHVVASIICLSLTLLCKVIAVPTSQSSAGSQRTLRVSPKNNSQAKFAQGTGCDGTRGKCVSKSSNHINVNTQSLISAPTPDSLRTLYWFSLGDSYSETGFNASGTLPSPGNPLGNPAYPGWTGGGGANWVDYLTTTYNRSLTLTYNLARGGATINSSLVTSGQGVSLEDEVATFTAKFSQHPSSTPWQTWNTLFSVWIGINDIGYTYDKYGSGDVFSDVLLDSYFKLVEQLYVSTGGNANAVPYHQTAKQGQVDRTPLMLARSVAEQEKERTVIEGFNDKLQTRINWFEGNHTDVRVWKWDSHAAFTAILDDPKAYGFQDATSYGSNSSYFWSGTYHPGSSAHMVFAKQVSDTLNGFPW